MIDKNTIMQVLGSIMKNPFLLDDSDYLLSPYDFITSFERYIFIAIHNLHENGADKIGIIDIDNYLIDNPGAYNIFEKEKGIEYLQDIEELCEPENFKYYYTKLKKFNCIRDLKQAGFNTDKIYSEDLLSENTQEINNKFENLSVEEIIDFIRADLSNIEINYSLNKNSESISANHKIDELLEELEHTPEVGIDFQGEIFNTVIKGARRGKFYLRSGGTGSGKTRSLVGDACHMAYPIRYNLSSHKWEQLGSSEKVLFISTEQSTAEIQTMILAYLSGVNEDIILLNRYTFEEKERVNKATQIMNVYKDNFFLTRIGDPNIQRVRAEIRNKCLKEHINYVFFDYIYSSPSLLNEFRDLKIREDVILCMLSTALKDIAVELNVFIMSSTQVNGEMESKKGIKDQSCIRGSKAIADKVDIGCITTVVIPEELNLLDLVIQKYGVAPNQVTDIYKVRRGRYNSVRIWSEVDLGTCRKRDLFITDARLNEVEGFRILNFIFDKEEEPTHSLLQLFNQGEVEGSTQDIENTLNYIYPKKEKLSLEDWIL